jgi:hypothetical protein
VTFADWYSSTIEPGVIQIANQIPDAAKRALILENSRELMAACWNAAVEAALVEWSSDPHVFRADRARALKAVRA